MAQSEMARRPSPWCWCLPVALGRIITRNALDIPTIGIGSGPDCDGQALVTQDMLGLFKGNVAAIPQGVNGPGGRHGERWGSSAKG